MRQSLYILTLAFGMALATTAHATVTTVSAPVTTPEVSISRGGSVTIVWNIVRTATAGPGAVVSSRGVFEIDGNPVATTNRVLRRSFSNGTTATAFNITETVVVPRSVIIQAQKVGGTLGYAREFTDDNVTFLGDEAAFIIGGTSGELAVAELDLTFEDGDFYRTVGLKEKLYAVAHVSFSGTGNFRAVWEVADESGTTAQPFWRPIGHISRPIGGNPDIVIKSPPLPTDTLGRLRVRLRLVDPSDNISQQPVLNYFVTEHGHGELPPFKPEVPASKGGGMRSQ